MTAALFAGWVLRRRLNKMERAQHFLGEAVRAGVTVVSLSLLSASAYASSITPSSNSTVFDVSGTYEGGATLSGTIDIDTVGNGGVTGGNLIVVSSGLTYDLGLSSSDPQFYSPDYWQVRFDTNGGAPEIYPGIFLGDSSNLDGYSGGPLCSETFVCEGNESDLLFQRVDPPLTSGNLTLATPEPTSLPLLLTGAGAAATLLHRKRKKA
jgi:hypothetical protein